MSARREGLFSGVVFVALACAGAYCLLYEALRRSGRLQRMETVSFPLDIALEELAQSDVRREVSIEARRGAVGRGLELLFLPLRAAEAARDGTTPNEAELELLRQRYRPLYERWAAGE